MNTDRRFWIGLGVFILIIGLICFFPYWFTSRSFRNIDFSETGQIGDTIGGIMGPFIAIGASILTFLAFWVQYQANVQQRHQYLESLRKQKEETLAHERIWRIERFENRFYELLKLHKANVEEMNIADKVRGRKCFVHMFYELRYCYIVVSDYKKVADSDTEENYSYSKIDTLDLAYRIFFYGLGHHSEKHFINVLNEGQMHLFRDVKSFLSKIQDSYLEFENNNPGMRYFTFGMPLSGIADERTVEFYYYPYDGHVNRLGHYYRHLFQTVAYVASQDFLTDDEKYGYVKTLRAQLSNFEQLMLYYNSLAWFDKEWREFFTRFRLIKNLPLPLADFHVRPENHYKKEIDELRQSGIEMFEWHE